MFLQNCLYGWGFIIYFEEMQMSTALRSWTRSGSSPSMRANSRGFSNARRAQFPLLLLPEPLEFGTPTLIPNSLKSCACISSFLSWHLRLFSSPQARCCWIGMWSAKRKRWLKKFNQACNGLMPNCKASSHGRKVSESKFRSSINWEGEAPHIGQHWLEVSVIWFKTSWSIIVMKSCGRATIRLLDSVVDLSSTKLFISSLSSS